MIAVSQRLLLMPSALLEFDVKRGRRMSESSNEESCEQRCRRPMAD